MRLTRLTALAAVGAAAIASPAMALGLPPAAPAFRLAGAVPAWATPGALRGTVPGTHRVGVDLLLRYRDPAGLAALDRRVSDPASRDYGHYLSARAFDSRFAPTPSQVAGVTSWLRTTGLAVDRVSSSRVLIAAHGTADQVEAAFGTVLGRYAYRGRVLQAPETQPVVPAALLPSVAAVVGLADTEALIRPDHLVDSPQAGPPPAFVNAQPCSSSYGGSVVTSAHGVRIPPAYGRQQPLVVCGYDATLLRHAYGVDTVRATGRGTTVAIVDAWASPTLEADVDAYSARHGLPKLAPGQLVEHDYPTATATPEGPAIIDPQGWAGEETLDAEAVHTMAPGAGIAYVAATDTVRGLEVAELEAVEEGYGNEVSNSWGSSGDFPTPEVQELVDETTAQAAAKGIGIYFSSGDSLDEINDDGFRSADFPATSPQVTAVGGTTLDLGPGGRYRSEVGWGELTATLSHGSWGALPGGYDGGGGGGVSSTYDEPDYQVGIVPRRLATYPGVRTDTLGNPVSTPGRVVPDVSLVADPNTGFVMGITQSFPDGSARYSEYRIGGTSLSCPLFAGLMAVADQVAGHHHGFANPALYAAWRAHRSAYRDVVAHGHPAQVRINYANNTDASQGYQELLRTAGETGTLSLLPGYDDSTGLGTPYGPGFLAALRR